MLIGRGPGSLQAPAVTAYAPPACRKCRASAEPVAAIAVVPRMKEAAKIGLMCFMNLDFRMKNSAGTFHMTSTTVYSMTLQAIRAWEPGSSERMVNHNFEVAVSPDLNVWTLTPD